MFTTGYGSRSLEAREPFDVDDHYAGHPRSYADDEVDVPESLFWMLLGAAAGIVLAMLPCLSRRRDLLIEIGAAVGALVGTAREDKVHGRRHS